MLLLLLLKIDPCLFLGWTVFEVLSGSGRISHLHVCVTQSGESLPCILSR